MKYRLVRSWLPQDCRVETAELLTQKEALALLRDLGSPYQGQVYDNHPTLSPPGPPAKYRLNFQWSPGHKTSGYRVETAASMTRREALALASELNDV